MPDNIEHSCHLALDLLARSSKAVGLAVSGGSDSLALLLLTHSWAEQRGVNVRVVSIDHGLRPEAAAETDLVRTMAQELALSCDILLLDGASSLPVGLRRDRHAMLAQWAQEQSLSVLALGHTADDRLETMSMRLGSGSGWYGLAAPQPASCSPVWPEGRSLRLIRPLLGLSRSELAGWLQMRQIKWCSDPSNLDMRTGRARIRAQIATISPEGRCRALSLWRVLLQLRAATMAELRSIISEYVLWFVDGSARVRMGKWQSMDTNLRARLLQVLIMAVSGREKLVRRHDCLAACARLDNAASPASLAGAWLIMDPEGAGIAAAPEGGAKTGTARPAQRLNVQTATSLIWDRRFAIHRQEGAAPGLILGTDAARFQGLEAIAMPLRCGSGHTGLGSSTGRLAKMARRSTPVLIRDHASDNIGFATPLHRERAEALLLDPVAETLAKEQ